MDLLGRYKVEQVLGKGAQGEVWRAFDTLLNRRVAIKILSKLDEDKTRKCFLEAQMMAKVHHLNIVTLYDLHKVDSCAFLIMEYVVGKPLSDAIGQSGLPVDEVIRIGSQIVSAMQAMHNAGLVHRDVKPSNIMLTEDSTPKLLDFGIATDESDVDDITALTMINGLPERIKGTIPYMAPEVISGGSPSPLSDIFSFGALLYEMFTGKKAFDARTEIAVLDAVLHQNHRPVTSEKPGIPKYVVKLIDLMLEKDPALRPMDMSVIQDVLLGKNTDLVRPFKTLSALFSKIPGSAGLMSSEKKGHSVG